MTVRRALFATLLAVITVARADVPEWLSGTPDVEVHADYAALYAAVFEDVAQRCAIDAEPGTLAHLRLVAAVNAAVADGPGTRREVYVAYLPWLVVDELDPKHCEFRLRSELIRQTLPGRAAP